MTLEKPFHTLNRTVKECCYLGMNYYLSGPVLLQPEDLRQEICYSDVGTVKKNE